MKSKPEKKRVCIEQVDKPKTQELIVDYSYGLEKPQKINIQIEVTQDNQILYYNDGRVLRKDELKPEYEILTNWYQIQNLRFIGDYHNFKKFGKWIIIWDGIELGGGYYDNGLKIGQWKEQGTNYSNLSKIIEEGEYSENKKTGRWNYFQNNNQIGGGLYDQEGVKIGKWVDTNGKFQEFSQITYTGEYRSGKKVGMWYIWNIKTRNRLIGGGLYWEGVKTGFWIEISEGFQSFSELTYMGNYKNGQKVGRWDIWFDDLNGNNKIGGGLYDETGGEQKIGQWIDISDGFSQTSEVTFKGEYKNGKKCGKWDSYFRDEHNNRIGGGSYDKTGQELKVGQWIEANVEYSCFSQVTYEGQYNNGKKVGEWDIWHHYYGVDELKSCLIGGGLYDKTGQEVKIGKWIEISNNFSDQYQVTYVGQYKNGKKVGRWNIWSSDEGKHKIGGGTYDKTGKECKVGEWIDVFPAYSPDSYLTFKGKYIQGKKVGRWDTFYKEEYEFRTKKKEIGGGIYDKGFKIGEWVDISDSFDETTQLMYQGEYQSGIKVGNWDTLFKKDDSEEKKERIGGGQYKEIQECKIGEWIEICDDYSVYKVTYKGKYNNGKKIGKWMQVKINKEKLSV